MLWSTVKWGLVEQINVPYFVGRVTRYAYFSRILAFDKKTFLMHVSGCKWNISVSAVNLPYICRQVTHKISPHEIQGSLIEKKKN